MAVQQALLLSMALVTIKPTVTDRRIARAIARHTTRPVESIAQGLTWGADEKLLLGLAIVTWFRAPPQQRPLADHFLTVSLVTAILPHVLKKAVDQKRPDRLTAQGHWRGVPTSGKPDDAFPSGHAVHMGALASAAALLSRKPRQALRTVALALSATRIVLLAHWASDVVTGFALGVVIERFIRRFTLRQQ